jgi:hypothetical protein
MNTVDFGQVMAWLWHFSPIAIGATGGFAFYKFVGCKTGACPITRNPWFSTIYGAVIGALMMGS